MNKLFSKRSKIIFFRFVMKTAALGNSLVRMHVFLEWMSTRRGGFLSFFPFDLATGKIAVTK